MKIMKITQVILIILIIILSFAAVVLTINKNNAVMTISAVVETQQNVQEQKFDDGTVSVSITAVGDCTLGTDSAFGIGGSFDAEFINNNNDFSYFLKNVKQYFEDDDITIINLEGTLTNGGTRAQKAYAFKGNPEYVNILTGSSIEAANLANNHSGDYGETGLSDTRNVLSDNGIISFGEKKFSIQYVDGIKVGLIGTNALTYAGRTGFLKVLEQLKTYQPDLIVASFHWGEELVTNPDYTQIQLAHLAIDNGVDLVIGHHPHVLQGIEKYEGKYILYSLGNFCFGGNKNPVDKDTMIFKQTFKFKDGQLLPDEDVSVIPCSVSSISSRNNFQPIPLTGTEFERVKNKIIQRSSGFEGIENISFFEADN